MEFFVSDSRVRLIPTGPPGPILIPPPPYWFGANVLCSPLRGRRFFRSWHKKGAAMSSTRQDLVKRLNEALTELHLLWRKEHRKRMDVFLREKAAVAPSRARSVRA